MDPWISLITPGMRDVERSRRFCRDGLGWPMSAASTEDIAFFRTGGVVLALYERELLTADANFSPEGTGFAGIALAHNVASREQVDAALVAAIAAGNTLLKPGTEAEWGGYSGYVADPDGFPGRSPGSQDSRCGRMRQSSCRSQFRPVSAAALRSRPHRLADLPTCRLADLPTS